MNLNKTIEINKLISIYSSLLTDKQKTVVEDYFYYNNTLAEIAENLSVTRQAVSDLIDRVVKILYKYDKKLNLTKKYDNINSVVNDLQNDETDENKLNKLRKIIKILED